MNQNKISNCKKKYIVPLLLSIFICIIVANLIYCFATKKEGVHSDELFSYSFANSQSEPLLAIESFLNAVPTNIGQWIDGKELTDKLSVSREHRFDYSAVLSNNTKDTHPYLYFCLLHTICSFFPDSFSWWYGFVLNVVLMVGSLILIYKIAKIMTDNDYVALACVLTYGLNQGAINTFVFIRMYALSTFLGLLYTYLHCLAYKRGTTKKIVALMCVTAFLGGITHYYFLVYAGVVSFVWCIFLIIRKKKFLGYGISLLLSVILGLLSDTAIQTKLFKTTESNMYNKGDFWFEFRTLLRYLGKELFGLEIQNRPTYLFIYFIEILLVAIVVFVPICFLLRKEPWFTNLVAVFKSNIIKFWHKLIEKINVIYIAIALGTIAMMAVASKVARMFTLGRAATRYVFNIYPYIFILLVIVLYWVIKAICILVGKFAKKRYHEMITILLMFASIIAGTVVIQNNCSYSFYNQKGIIEDLSLDELPRDASYVVSMYETWLTDCLTESLRGVNSIYVMEQKFVDYYIERLTENSYDDQKYFILTAPKWKEFEKGDEDIELGEEFIDEYGSLVSIDNKNTKEYIENIEQKFINENKAKELKYIGTSDIFGRIVFVFEIK